MKQTVGFIGGGNMAGAIIGGLIKGGHPVGKVLCAEPSAERRAELNERYGIAAIQSNRAIIAASDVLVFAVKPQVLKEVCEAVAEGVKKHAPLCLSIAAGVRLQQISRWLGGHDRLVRAMPNTPALLGAGATGLYAGDAVQPAQREMADAVMRACGVTVWVGEEGLIDAVTAVSGSGPAYYFRLTELMAAAGEQLGLDPETAALLARHTASGAGHMLCDTDDAPAELRRRVTSPGGTTERALASFEGDGLPEIVQRALSSARDRAQELSDHLEAE